MTKAATVHVPDDTLKWARDRAHVDIMAAAEKCGHDVSEVTSWEGGQSDPPVTALRELAAMYGLPLAAFLLTTPKEEPKPPKDYRNLAGIEHPTTTARLALALNRATGLQVLAAELLEGLDAAPFAVAATEDVDAAWLAVQERAALGVTLKQQLAWRDEDEAFRSWRAAIERRGAFVLQMSLSKTDVRAFSLRADPPVIVVNRTEWARAKLFSLAHEFGHVVIGGSGICIPGSSKASGIEAYCNEFADALLVPTDALTDDPDATRIRMGEAASDMLVKRIANRFKVSPAVVWYRLMQTKAIDRKAFEAQWDAWSVWRPPPEEGGGPSATAKNVVRDYGVALPDLMLRGSKKGLLNEVDIAQYLNVPSDKIASIESEIASRLAH